MVKCFLDTTVLLFAVGGPGPERDECRAFLSRAQVAGTELHISVEAAQEYVFHRTRRAGRPAAVAEGRELPEMYVVHDFTASIQALSLDLMERSPIRGRDAVHAATALAAGFTEIVSMDRDFEDVPGLRRIAPRDAV